MHRNRYPSLKNDPDLHNIFPNVDVFAAQLSCKSEGFSKNWEVASEEPEECWVCTYKFPKIFDYK